MSVDATSVGDRLRERIPLDHPARPLVDQLAGTMSDAEYLGLAIGITKLLSKKEA